MARKKTDTPDAVPQHGAATDETFAGAHLVEIKRFLREEPMLKAEKDSAATAYAKIHKEFKDKFSDMQGVQMGMKLIRMERATRNIRLRTMLEFMVAAERVAGSQDDMFDNERVVNVLAEVLHKATGGVAIEIASAARDESQAGDADAVADEGATGYGGWDEAAGPQELSGGDGEGEFPPEDQVDGPVADAGDDAAVHDPAAEEALASGGAAYNEGAQAAFDGLTETDNPYAEGKDGADPVKAGLWAAGYGDTVNVTWPGDGADEAAFGATDDLQDEGQAEEAAAEPEAPEALVEERSDEPAAEAAGQEFPVYGADGEVVDIAPSPEAWVARAIEIVGTLDDVEEIKAFAAANERHVSPLMPLADWQTLTVPLIDAIAERRKAASKVVKAVFAGAGAASASAAVAH